MCVCVCVWREGGRKGGREEGREAGGGSRNEEGGRRKKGGKRMASTEKTRTPHLGCGEQEPHTEDVGNYWPKEGKSKVETLQLLYTYTVQGWCWAMLETIKIFCLHFHPIGLSYDIT